jgi:hypothetical protein
MAKVFLGSADVPAFRSRIQAGAALLGAPGMLKRVIGNPLLREMLGIAETTMIIPSEFLEGDDTLYAIALPDSPVPFEPFGQRWDAVSVFAPHLRYKKKKTLSVPGDVFDDLRQQIMFKPAK